jgi:hypothetical protein
MKMKINSKSYQMNLHIFYGLNVIPKMHSSMKIYFWDEFVLIKMNFVMHVL